MIDVKKIGWVLILLSVLPFFNFYSSQKNFDSPLITGNTVRAVNTQLMGFLLDKEEIFNKLLSRYDNGLFVFDGSDNVLLDTLISVETIRELGLESELSVNFGSEVLRSVTNYYNNYKGEQWFSPSYSYSYYKLNEYYGSEVSQSVRDELIGLILKFQSSDGGFSKTVGLRGDVVETYYALKGLKELGYDVTGFKSLVFNFLASQKGLSDLDKYYFFKVVELFDNRFKLGRETLLSCLVKSYLPFQDTSSCALILREHNVFLYLPSVGLLLLGWFLIR